MPPAGYPERDYGLDHTAPWRCGANYFEGFNSRCKICEGKPTYREWAEARKERSA